MKITLDDELDSLLVGQAGGKEQKAAYARQVLREHLYGVERETPEQRELRGQFQVRYQHLGDKRKTLAEIEREKAPQPQVEVIEGGRLKEGRAIERFRQGVHIYDVSKETGLPQSRLIELQRQRLAEDRATSRAAEDDRARRIALGPDKVDEDEPEGTFPQLDPRLGHA